MRAVVFAGEGEVRVEDVPKPSIAEPGDAVIKVSLTAICGSDLHLLDGKTPGMRVGSVIGHEFVGTIEDAGEGFSPGERVLGSFLIACGACGACTAGRFNLCSNRRALGLGQLTGDLDGAQAEYVRVPNATLNLKRLAGPLDGLSDEQVLFGGDVLTTGYFGAHLAGDAASVAVVGAGPIGLFTAVALKGAGKRVVVLDIDPQRVDFANEILGSGAHLATDHPHNVVMQALDGELADASVDAVGTVPAFKSALRVVRDGGRVVVVGVYGAERYELPMGMAWIRGLDIVFSGMGNIHAHWDEALEAIRNGTVDPTAIITHRLPLEDAAEGYRLFAAREATKVVLTPAPG